MLENEIELRALDDGIGGYVRLRVEFHQDATIRVLVLDFRREHVTAAKIDEA